MRSKSVIQWPCQALFRPDIRNGGVGEVAYILLRFAIGGVFITSGAIKLFDPAVFAVLIDAFGILPQSYLMPVAILLPILEVSSGIGLIADIRGSLSVITALLVLFIGILSYALFLGLDIDCGCFGPNDPEAKAFHGLKHALFRDLLMLSGAIYLYFWRYQRKNRSIFQP